jgi:calcineurin-like phosphoesterase family protein
MQRVYVVSDTHFDHTNIIRYCNRGFGSVDDMNRTLMENWNDTIRKGDTVYFLGDLTYGKNSRGEEYWRRRLHGSVRYLRGNHDHKPCPEYQYLDYEGRKFMLTHVPYSEPTKSWKGWIIHGHVHNNEMDVYPFINGQQKTINVSVELTGYKPVEMDYITALDLDTVKWMVTADSRPIRW